MSANDLFENDFNCQFWEEIEKEIEGKIPNMIKIVLSKSGYEHRFSLQNLTISDINDIEEHAKNQLKDKLKRWLKSDSNYEHLNSSEFTFLPGHRKLICIISQKLSVANEVKSASTNSESAPPLAAPTSTESAKITSEANVSQMSQYIAENERGDNVLISIDKQSQLEADLCKHIRQWMIGKMFHNSVSESIYDYMNIYMHVNI